MTEMRDNFRSFKRSWVHHTGMQLATLTVLSATLTVVAFALSMSLNLNRLLAAWGDTVNITAYLAETVNQDGLPAINDQLLKIPSVGSIDYIAREVATEQFKSQMASYAPSLLKDEDFANPFPASYRIHLKGGVRSAADVKELEKIAQEIGKIPGIEDVSFGQSWVKNFSEFVTTLMSTSGVIIAVLLAGALLVIGNSVRASISSRREEIEIMELVGATSGQIRRPYIAEGFLMGALAASIALASNFVLHFWLLSIVQSSMTFGRLAPLLGFMNLAIAAVFILTGGLLGATGAGLTIRKLNTGWSAMQRTEGL